MSQPYEIFGSQNLKDDDGQVIDSFFIETDTMPDLKTATEPVPPTAKTNPVKPARLLTGSIQMDTTRTVGAVQILPADTNRKSVTFTATSTAASPTALVEYILLSDENSKVSGNAGFNVRHARDPLTLIDYTGPVWAMPASTVTATMELTWIAVTS